MSSAMDPLLQHQRILITGGLGYVGGRVAQYFSKNHPEVNLRLTTHRRGIQKPGWLAKGDVVEMDLVNDDDIERACQDIDVILHLAALHEVDCAKDAKHAVRVNERGTFKVLESAKHCNVKRFIYFSTAHVYGAPLAGEINELTVTRPVGAYAVTHKAAGEHVLAAAQRKEIEGLVVRLSNGFGAPISASGGRWTLVVNDLCRQAVMNKQITLRSAGLQYRDFITLTDVSRAVSHLVGLPRDQLQDGLFNLGGECSMQIKEIAELIQKRCKTLFGYKPPLCVGAQSSADQTDKLAYNINNLKSTGFELTRQIDDAIDETLLFCDQKFKK